jgi:hypothetical protein
LVGPHLPPALAAAAWPAEPEPLGRQWPTPLKHDGRGKGGRRTAHGMAVAGWVPSSRRTGQRRAGKRAAGVSAGLGLWGIDERCPPAVAAAVSLWAAMLGSVDEAQAVWTDRGMA